MMWLAFKKSNKMSKKGTFKKFQQILSEKTAYQLNLISKFQLTRRDCIKKKYTLNVKK